MIRLRSHFKGRDRRDLHEREVRQKQAEQSRREDQKRKAEAADDVESDVLTAAVEMVLATEQEIEAFTIKLDAFENRLDAYDKATVEALMKTQAELDEINARLEQVQEELEDMRQNAFILEDGRRIFVSADQTRAIDELGENVPIGLVPLDAVSPTAPTAENYEAHLQHQQDLSDARIGKQGEIDAIHRFDELHKQSRDRHDTIRADIEKGDVTKEQLEGYEEELEAMDKDLIQHMPPSVRASIPDFKLDADTPDMKSDFAAIAAEENALRVAAPAAKPTLAPDIQSGG